MALFDFFGSKRKAEAEQKIEEQKQEQHDEAVARQREEHPEMQVLKIQLMPEHLHVVVPLPKNMAEITRIIREEIEYKGVSVIIPRRECIQTAARHAREARKAKEEKK